MNGKIIARIIEDDSKKVYFVAKIDIFYEIFNN